MLQQTCMLHTSIVYLTGIPIHNRYWLDLCVFLPGPDSLFLIHTMLIIVVLACFACLQMRFSIACWKISCLSFALKLLFVELTICFSEARCGFIPFYQKVISHVGCGGVDLCVSISHAYVCVACSDTICFSGQGSSVKELYQMSPFQSYFYFLFFLWLHCLHAAFCGLGLTID